MNAEDDKDVQGEKDEEAEEAEERMKGRTKEDVARRFRTRVVGQRPLG